MSKINFSPDLNLLTHELRRFQEFMQDEGYVKGLLNTTENFGIVKLDSDKEFKNGKVSISSNIIIDDLVLSTIKVEPLVAFDKDGKMIVQRLKDQITIQNDSNWYWVRSSYQESVEEDGEFTLSSTGQVTGVGGSLTEVLRGSTEYPVKVRFLNSSSNTGEYEVLEVIDDNNLILNGITFAPEVGLKIGVVGSFTPGVSIPTNNKFPYRYDSSLLEVVPEASNNTPPTTGYIEGKTFYLARVRNQEGTITVQDKRLHYWELQGTSTEEEITRSQVSVVGVEEIRFPHIFSPKDRNYVKVGWGVRSQGWSVNTTLNSLTLHQASGGIYKDVNDIPEGVLTGWRVYTSNGRYSKIYNSTKQGQSIVLNLDLLDIDNYSSDGGSTFDNNEIVIVPDCENISLKFKPVGLPTVPEVKVTLSINTGYTVVELLAFLDPTSTYQVSYRLQSKKESTSWSLINQDPVGYLKEISFDLQTGELISSQRQIVSDNGVITLQIHPQAFKNFTQSVSRGDVIGVNTITSLQSSYDLFVGVSKIYQHIKMSSLTSSGNVTFNLRTQGATEGSSFTIHFDCERGDLGNSKIYIQSEGMVVKTISQPDMYSMMNQEKGISFSCIFNGEVWVVSQNYDLGQPFELKQVIGSGVNPFSEYFDEQGWGKVRGYFGFHIANGSHGTQDLRKLFLVGSDNVVGDYSFGTRKGQESVALTAENNGPHTHSVTVSIPADTSIDGTGSQTRKATSTTNTYNTTSSGQGVPHENRPPYFAILYAQKMY